MPRVPSRLRRQRCASARQLPITRIIGSYQGPRQWRARCVARRLRRHATKPTTPRPVTWRATEGGSGTAAAVRRLEELNSAEILGVPGGLLLAVAVLVRREPMGTPGSSTPAHIAPAISPHERDFEILDGAGRPCCADGASIGFGESLGGRGWRAPSGSVWRMALGGLRGRCKVPVETTVPYGPPGGTMRRREFIGLFGSAAVAWPLATRGQTAARLRRVVWLGMGRPNEPSVYVDALLAGLRELGWIESQMEP